MKHSVFSTPLVRPLLKGLLDGWLKLSGWRVVVEDLPKPPYVFIGAPHTSNWDFLYLMAAVFHLKMDIRWMGKHTLFPYGLGWFMRWLGGIPVNREKAHNMVARMASLIEAEPDTILCIPPEGTRSEVARWKTGFYHIARKAEVPIYMAAIDAGRKELRMLGQFHPSGNLDEDMETIRQRYAGLEGLK